VKDDAVVSGVIGFDGEASGRATVVGNTIVFSDGSVNGDAIVNGGILNGEVGGSACDGTFGIRKNFAYYDGMNHDDIYDNLPHSQNFGEVYGKDFRTWWKWAIDRLWSKDYGMVIRHGRSLWIDCSKEEGIEQAERLGVEPKKDGWLHLFVGPDLLVNLTGLPADDVGYFTIGGYFGDFWSGSKLICSVGTKPAPFVAGGKIEKESIVVGNAFIDGYVGGEIAIVHDNSKVGGEIDGNRIMLYSNSALDGNVKGDELLVESSVIEGTVEVAGGRKDFEFDYIASEIEDSYLTESADVQGHFDIDNSLIEGAVYGNTFYGDEDYQGKTVWVSASSVYKDEIFSLEGIDYKPLKDWLYEFGGQFHHYPNRHRLFGKFTHLSDKFDLYRLEKIRGPEYYKSYKKALDWEEAETEKYHKYLGWK
jgi:hypothetical protein